MTSWAETPLEPPLQALRDHPHGDTPEVAGLRLLVARDEVVSGLARRSRADFRPLPTLLADSRDALVAAFEEAALDAPPGLVAELADLLTPRFDRVAGRLRRRVARARRVIPLRAVRELDPACLRRNARLPGRSLIEKAGPRQRITAVVRVERFDTMENRVLKSVCARLVRRIDRLRAAWPPALRGARGGRARALRDLRRSCDDVLDRPELAAVGLPRVGERPSNALLGDPDYRAAWRAWQLLRREEEAFRGRWRGLDAAWCEIVFLAIQDSLERRSELESVPDWLRVDSGADHGRRLAIGGPRRWIAAARDHAAAVTVERSADSRLRLQLETREAGSGSRTGTEVLVGLHLEPDGHLVGTVAWNERTLRVERDWLGSARTAADAVVADVLHGTLRSARPVAAGPEPSRLLGVCALDRAVRVEGDQGSALAGVSAATLLPVPEEPDLFVGGRAATWLDASGPAELHGDEARLGGQLLASLRGRAGTAVVVPDALHEGEAAALRRHLGRTWLVWSVVAAALAAAESMPELFGPPATPRRVAVLVLTDAVQDLAILEQRGVDHAGETETLWVRSVALPRRSGRQVGAALDDRTRGAWLRSDGAGWGLDGDGLHAVTLPRSRSIDAEELFRVLDGPFEVIVAVGLEEELAELRCGAQGRPFVALGPEALARGARVFLARHERGLPTWKDLVPRIDVEARSDRLRVAVSLLDSEKRLIGPGEQVDFQAPTVFQIPPGQPVVTFPMRREGAIAPFALRLEGPPLPLREPVSVRLHIRFQYGLQGVEGALVPTQPGRFERVSFRFEAATSSPEVTSAEAPPWPPRRALTENQRRRVAVDVRRLDEVFEGLRQRQKKKQGAVVSPREVQDALRRLEDHLAIMRMASDGGELLEEMEQSLGPELDWLLGVRKLKGAGKAPDLGPRTIEWAARVRAALGGERLLEQLVDGRLALGERVKIRCLGLLAGRAPSPAWDALLGMDPERPLERGVWAHAVRDALRGAPEVAPSLGAQLPVLLERCLGWVEEMAGEDDVVRRKDDLFLVFDLIPQLTRGRSDGWLQPHSDEVVAGCVRLDRIRQKLPEEVRIRGHRGATGTRDEPVAVAIAWLQGRYETMAEVEES